MSTDPSQSESRAVCLMGPTASGKTDIAIELVESLPLEIISVDSAMVYRTMDIGTAKPDRATLARAPHRLLDIRDPEEPYSAGDFVRDAEREMADIRARGRVPLLVGGTMMYFRALTQGMAALPSADAALRAAIDEEAADAGWPGMHRRLSAVDAEAARRISPNDSQRIQRALEVWRATGKRLSDWHREQAGSAAASGFIKVGILPADREVLHLRIAERLARMFEAGFVDEVRRLKRRPRLTRTSPSMRAVGYRQVWAHLEGETTLNEAMAAAGAATRRLAKRQTTWLRSEPLSQCVDPLERDSFAAIQSVIGREIGEY